LLSRCITVYSIFHRRVDGCTCLHAPSPLALPEPLFLAPGRLNARLVSDSGLSVQYELFLDQYNNPHRYNKFGTGSLAAVKTGENPKYKKQSVKRKIPKHPSCHGNHAPTPATGPGGRSIRKIELRNATRPTDTTRWTRLKVFDVGNDLNEASDRFVRTPQEVNRM